MKKYFVPAALALAAAIAVPSLIGANPKKAADDPKKNAAPPPAAEPGTLADAAPDPVEKLPAVVATIGKTEIKKDEVLKAFNSVISAQGLTADALPAEQKEQLLAAVLENIIADKLLTKSAANEKVSDQEVNEQFAKIAERFGSVDQLKKEIAAHGQTEEQVRDDVRESLRQQHWIEGQLKGKTDVTDAEVKAYYDQNISKYAHPELVRASHILVTVPEDSKPEAVAEKQKQAKSIADRVKKGEDFGTLAEQLSEDPDAKETKGDLGYFSKDSMSQKSPEVANAAFSLKKDQVSDPIQSKYGFHVLKVTDHKEAGTTPETEVKGSIESKLKRRKENEEVDKLIRGIRTSSDVKVNIPEPLPQTAPSADEEPAPAPPADAPAPPPATPATEKPAPAATPAPAGKKK